MFKHYLTTALRHFRQHKLTTGINVVCLTIGLVCFLGSYSMVTYFSSGDKHFANSDRVYMLMQSSDASPGSYLTSWVAAKYLKADAPEIETVARATFNSGLESEVPVSAGERKGFMHVAYADPEFLEVFALPFLVGESRSALRAPRSAVLSKDGAVRLFGAPQSALGRTLRLQDGSEVTVRGVVDALRQPSHISTSGDAPTPMVRFDVLMSMDVFESNPATQRFTTGWDSLSSVFTYVVLPRDHSFGIDSLRSRLEAFGPRHAWSDGKQRRFNAISVADYYLTGMGSMARTDKNGPTLMYYFLGVVVLLISCLNYANLATAHATTRAKEIGMRRVVGASRGQIAVQFLLEAALLSSIALMIAMALMATAIHFTNIPGVAETLTEVMATSAFWITLFALLVAVTLAAGAYPAFVLSSVRPLQAVRNGKLRRGDGLATSFMVCLQFVGATLLIISMLVMGAQNRESKRSALSDSGETLVEISNDVQAAGVDFDVLRSALLRQPHIQAVTASAVSPWMIMTVSSRVANSPDEVASTVYAAEIEINSNFFSTLGMKLLAGRDFDREHANDVATRNESAAAYTPNVVIDQALAEQNGWRRPDDALGKTVYLTHFEGSVKSRKPRTVIGVVENRSMGVLNLQGGTSNLYEFSPSTATQPVIRIASADSAAALREIESVWDKLAPSVALKIQFADDAVNRLYESFESSTAVFGGVATLALIVSILGLIGMSIHVIGRRQHEIGLRKTLGASVYSVVRLLLLDFSKPVVIANAIAWPIAFIAMQAYLSIFTQRIGLTATPFVVGLITTVVIAWIAVGVQTTRAARLNPATVLRYE